MLPSGNALIKNPDSILAVSFDNSVLSIKTSVCSYSRSLTGFDLKKTPVPGQMTIEISSCGPNALRVRYLNHRLGKTNSLRYIDTRPSGLGSIDETEDHIIFRSNTFEARISKASDFGIDFYYRDKLLTSSRAGKGGASYITASGVADNYRVSDNALTSETLTMSSDERFYGLGSNGVSLLLNGKKLKAENKRSIGSRALDTQNIPFFLSSSKYGIFVNTITPATFSFGADYDSAVSFGTSSEELEYIIFAEDDMMSILNLLNGFLGIAKAAPSWSVGTSVLLRDDKTLTDVDVLNFVDGLKDSGIEINEIWLSNLWQSPGDPLGFDFDLQRFPDPAVFCRKMHDRGIRVGLSIDPYISDNSPYFDECIETDILLKAKDGSVFMRDLEYAGAAILDLTNIGGRSFLCQRTDALLQLGIDTVEADFKYALFDLDEDEVAFSNGLKPSEVCNYYAGIFNDALYDTVSRSKGLRNAMIIADSASTGSQLFPYTNIIPSDRSYEALAVSIRKCLSLGLSGVGAVNIDTPFFTPGSDDMLFRRWIQFGSVSSHMRISLDAKIPLTDYKGVLETIKIFGNLRKNMRSHFHSILCEVSTLGSPSAKPLFAALENDLSARHIDRQFLIGSSIMAAPVTSGSGSVSYYVPSGVWTNLLTRERIQGPCFKTSKCDGDNIPLLVRPNSVLVSATPDIAANDDPLNNVTFSVFELASGAIAAFEVFSSDASHSGIINVLREGNKITVRTEGFGPNKRLMLCGIKNVVSVSESMPNVSDWGTSVDFNSKELIITLG